MSTKFGDFRDQSFKTCRNEKVTYRVTIVIVVWYTAISKLLSVWSIMMGRLGADKFYR